jgi:hypothetical protein
LDATVSQFLSGVITEVEDWMVSKGLSIGWITGTTTVREVLQYIQGNLTWQTLNLAGEEF